MKRGVDALRKRQITKSEVKPKVSSKDITILKKSEEKENLIEFSDIPQILGSKLLHSIGNKELKKKSHLSFILPRVKISFLFLYYFFGFLLFLSFVFLYLPLLQERINRIERDFLASYDLINSNLREAEEGIKKSDYETALTSFQQAKGGILHAKEKVSLFGQGQRFFEMYSLKPSEITKKEVMLSAAYDTLSITDDLSQNLVAISNVDDFLSNDYLFNLKDFYVELELVFKKTENSLAAQKKRLLPLASRSDSAQNIFSKLQSFENRLKETKDNSDIILEWLTSGDKKILILFQNNSELRGGSGGSLGSFGVANIADGKFRNIDFGSNIYKLDKDFLSREKIPAPSELEVFNEGFWSLKHAGFAVCGREALDNIRLFYGKETGQEVDGVLSIDTTAFANLLKVIGPLELKDYSKTLTAENFKTEIENEVQIDYFQRDGGMSENEPKSIIGDAMPVFFERFFDALRDRKKIISIVSAINQSLSQKNILANASVESVRERLDQFNYSGAVKYSFGDYLYVNNSNLAGEKTNQNIKETIDFSATILDDGKVNNTLLLQREHLGDGVWPDGLDRNYIRALILKDSEVTNFLPIAGNFQRYYDRGYRDNSAYWLDEEAGKTSVNFWMSTKPKEASSAKISYTSKYQLDLQRQFSYEILFQKQPGAPDSEVILTLNYPEGFHPLNVINYDKGKNALVLRFKLDRDRIVKINFAKND